MQLVGVFLAQLFLKRAADHTGAQYALHVDQRGVPLDRHNLDKTLELAILWDQAKTVTDGVGKRTIVNFLSADIDLAGFRLVNAEDGAGKLGAASADQTRNAKYLAGLDLKADVLQNAAAEIFDLQNRSADVANLFRILLTHLTADHHVDQALTVNGSDRNRVDVTAVAQDADVAAQAEDFVQTVRDIDDGDALVAQLLDNAEHNLQLAVGQNGRRLIHDQDAGIIVNGVHDLDDLLFRDGQRRDLRVDVDVHAEIFNDLPRAAAHALPVNQTVFQLDVAKEHIFRNAQRLGQLDFLMDNADAGTACLDGAVKAAGLAVQNDFALIRLVDTGQNLNQGGLACAVLADQTVDGAALNVDGDVIQRLDAGELFCDIL